MVRHAFRVLTDDKIKTRLIAFSDDMDGLRKVPDNVPNKEMVARHLGKPLTKVPDPFGTHRQLRRAQQRAAARLPRSVRFRLRVHVVDRLLHVGPLRRCAPEGAGSFRGGDGGHAAVAARGARAILFAVPADLAAHRRGAAGAGVAHDAKAGTITYEDPDTAERVTTLGHRRPLQAAMEAGLGDALGRARRRLRNGRQGSDRLGQTLRRNLPRARRHAARRFQLRAFSRRERPENFEVEGQRAHHRRVAALRQSGEPVAVHVSRAEVGQAALFRRHPAARRRLSAISGRL